MSRGYLRYIEMIKVKMSTEGTVMDEVVMPQEVDPRCMAVFENLGKNRLWRRS